MHVYFSCGSIFNRRHIPELIDGFKSLAARMPDVRLEIVGDNRTSPRIDMDQLIAASGVSDRVHWRSYVSDADLAALYSTASAFAGWTDCWKMCWTRIAMSISHFAQPYSQ